MGETLEYRAATPRFRHSRAGIASVMLGGLCLIALFLSLQVRAGGAAGTSPDLSPFAARIIGLSCLACPVLGAALGVVGLLSKERKRLTAIIGLSLNGVILVLLAVMVAIFFAVR
jgi:hypothetical protein